MLYSAILLTISAGLGFAAYIFMTPVTPANFDMRVSAMCEVSNLASSANGRFGLTGVKAPILGCSCIISRLTAQNGIDGAARLTEMTRQLFLNAVMSTLSARPIDVSGFDGRDLARIRTFLSGLQIACAAH